MRKKNELFEEKFITWAQTGDEELEKECVPYAIRSIRNMLHKKAKDGGTKIPYFAFTPGSDAWCEVRIGLLEGFRKWEPGSGSCASFCSAYALAQWENWVARTQLATSMPRDALFSGRQAKGVSREELTASSQPLDIKDDEGNELVIQLEDSSSQRGFLDVELEDLYESLLLNKRYKPLEVTVVWRFYVVQENLDEIAKGIIEGYLALSPSEQERVRDALSKAKSAGLKKMAQDKALVECLFNR